MYKRIVFLFAVILIFGLKQGLTANLSNILKETEARYAKFEEAVKDMTILQEVKIITPNGDMTQDVKMFKKRKKFRMEFAMQMPQTQGAQGMEEIKTFIIYDGIDMWMISPFMGKKKLSSEEGGQYQMQKNWWESISEKAEIVGTENVDGQECHVLAVKEGSGSMGTCS